MDCTTYCITTYSYDSESETTETCKTWLLFKNIWYFFLVCLYNKQNTFYIHVCLVAQIEAYKILVQN